MFLENRHGERRERRVDEAFVYEEVGFGRPGGGRLGALPGLWRAVAHVREQARAFGVDAVMAYDPHLLGLVGYRVARALRVPFAIRLVSHYGLKHEHTGQLAFAPFGWRRVERAVERFLYRRARAVLVACPSHRDYVERTAGGGATVLPYVTAQAALFYDDVPPDRSVREALAPGAREVAVAVTRLVAEKYPADLVECAARLRERAGFTLLVVGEGPLRPELEALARRLQAPVVFAGARPQRRARPLPDRRGHGGAAGRRRHHRGRAFGRARGRLRFRDEPLRGARRRGRSGALPRRGRAGRGRGPSARRPAGRAGPGRAGARLLPRALRRGFGAGGRARGGAGAAVPSPRPSMIPVSVVVPLRDEEAGVEALLDDLCAQERAPEAILMVDTGSGDRTRERVAARARRDSRVSLLCLPTGYPGAGRNAGLRAARTPWVAFADGGTRLPTDWLARLMEPVDRGQAVDLVLGAMEAEAATRRQRAAALAYVPARRALPDGRTWRGFFLASSVVRREAAFAAGGFAEHLRSGEDLLFLRALQRPDNVAYAPEAVVRWSHSSGARAVWRRFRTYAEHSLHAGLMDDWFAVMRRRYLWMLLLGPAFPLGLAGLLLARALVMQRRKPEFVAGGLGRLAQAIEVAGLLGVIDAATWAAWLAWRRAGAPRAETAGALSSAELADEQRAGPVT